MTAVEPRARLGGKIADPGARGQPGFRYGAVLAVILVLMVVEVLSPDTDLARALSVALAAGALTVAVATSRERAAVRRRRARVVGAAAVVTVIGVATGVISVSLTWLVATVIVAMIPLALGGGLLRLIRDEGVTLQAVAGALAVYLVVGLLFAAVIAFLYYEQPGYFAQRGPVNNGDRVYYSFTVLTTTGFGDYTPATALGHAVAVLEMLMGQLYLVTVIGVLVGNYSGRTAAARSASRRLPASGASGGDSGPSDD